VHEILAQQYDVSIAYSSLTYLVRKHHLREPVKRAGEYYFDPGVEMQHDTSPHQVVIAGKTIKAQCASLVLAFSRKLFIQYYPCYTRFEAKNFLRQALLFMQGSCQRCVIDNTSVILAAGAGKYAVITPEMVFFSRIFGFEFIAHAVNHPDRKGRVERPFAYAENNFLAGRSFNDWHDLNQQALQWCETVANSKHKKSLGMTPESAYIQEKPALQLLPKVLPPIYEHCQRIVDTQGFVNIDTNRYSMPESLIGNTVDIYKYLEEIEIHFQHHFIARHSRLLGQRNQRSLIKGHHPSLYRRETRYAECEAEKQLTGHHVLLDAYITELKSHVRGRGGWELKRLLHFKQQYPLEAFIAAIKQAHQYGLYDMHRLENIILKCIAGDFFIL
jgi:hypothetical protein